MFFQVLLRGFPLPADRPVLGLFDGAGYVCSLRRGQSPGQRLRPDQRPGAASALTPECLVPSPPFKPLLSWTDGAVLCDGCVQGPARTPWPLRGLSLLRSAEVGTPVQHEHAQSAIGPLQQHLGLAKRRA